MIKFYKVVGDSMSPRLKNGDLAIGLKYFNKNKLKKNDLVVFSHKQYGTCIKKITSSNHPGQTFNVSGENLQSTSSNSFGEIPFSDVKSKIVFHF